MSAPVSVEEQADGGTAGSARHRLGWATRALLPAFLGILLFSVLAVVPLPFAIMKPGPVRDTLGEYRGEPLIQVDGHPTYPTEGALELTTVSVFGGPGGDVFALDVLLAWLRPEESVLPEDEVFPPDVTEQDIEQRNAEEMVSSQENATAAAMHELGIPVPTTLTVAGFSPGSDAEEMLAEGDVVLAVDGQEVPDLPQLRDRMQQVDPGHPVTVRVERDGAPVEVEVTTTRGPEGETLLGVLIDPRYQFPFDVSIQIEDIGGPSAGMMFALGIVDKLTPGAMTGGERIAGTGTIDSSGRVGPIGGIRQKLVGAASSGATHFLAPAGNCDEVVGAVPEGLQVVRVETLGEARDAVEAIADGADADLPTCG